MRRFAAGLTMMFTERAALDRPAAEYAPSSETLDSPGWLQPYR